MIALPFLSASIWSFLILPPLLNWITEYNFWRGGEVGPDWLCPALDDDVFKFALLKLHLSRKKLKLFLIIDQNLFIRSSEILECKRFTIQGKIMHYNWFHSHAHLRLILVLRFFLDQYFEAGCFTQAASVFRIGNHPSILFLPFLFFSSTFLFKPV